MGSVWQEGNVGNVNNRGAGYSIGATPGHGFEVGDMVWGKVKSHPWWPGHVYSEELTTPSVRRSKRDDLLLVAFFGDSSYGWFDPSELIPFDSNFSDKSLRTNSRTFVKALEEAIDEVRRRTALGLSCMCRNKQNFRQTDAHGFFAVDVAGYEPGAVYSIDTTVKARESFQTRLTLDFVRELALEPTDEHDDIDFIKNKATVMSYRRTVFEEIDETYDQAFSGDLVRPLSGSVQVSSPRKKPSKAPLSGRQVFDAKHNKPPKKDKYIFKRREKETKTEKVKDSSSSTFEDPAIANIVTESNNSDLEINTPICSLFHKSSNCSGSHKISGPEKEKPKALKRPAGEPCSLLPEKKTKRNKVTGELSSGNSENKKKRKMANGDGEALEMVLTNLHSFALDPTFQTNNRKLRLNVQKVFLKFRSLVFQKSLNSVTQNEANDKSPVRPPDDPTKGSGVINHEEIIAKKKKKIDEESVKMRKSGQEVGQRAVERTILKMEFPAGGSLPSISKLKAKLGRYGKLDHDGTRIYWKTFTCLVVFKYKADALAAFKAAQTSTNLFGNTHVKFSLKDVSPSKLEDSRPPVVVAPGVPVKSCLKKSGGEEKPRVQFSFTGDESRNSSTVQSTPPPPPPSLPLRPMVVAPLPPPRLHRPAAMPPPPNIDIRQQMVSLLTRCNDVVAHVTGVLGYVPYHAL
ncbi:hypothetical protein LXL04_038936 [Taraxacum kok-saghyz]